MPENEFFDPSIAPRDGQWIIFYFSDPLRADSEEQVTAAFDERDIVWRDGSGNTIDVSKAVAASVK